METRALCVVFLACQLVLMGDSSHGSSPYGGNGHVGKKGSERRYPNHYDRSRTSKSRTCSDSFEAKSNYIIRTKESLDNDATFIDAIRVETSDACIKQCCDAHDVVDDDDGESTITCDATVFVDGDDAFEKKESNCFLFQCRFEKGERFRCKFSDHDSYTSSMFGGFGAEPYFEADEEEQEGEEETEEEQIPQTKAVPATTQWKADDKNTNEEEIEEEECNASQFKCDSGECIRLTLLCDDYQDCEDNSDESDRCTAIDGLWKIWRYMYGSSAPDYPTEYPPDTDDSEDNQVKEGDEEEQQEEEKEENDVDDTDSGNEDDDSTLTNSIPVKVATTSASSVSDQGNKDTTSKPVEAHQSSAPDRGNKSKTNEVHKVPSSGDHSEVKVVDKQGVTATAVLPLTIGLFLTLFLLLMMSCRLRYMNRRLRYGRLKTNNAHDADYLINGMYL